MGHRTSLVGVASAKNHDHFDSCQTVAKWRRSSLTFFRFGAHVMAEMVQHGGALFKDGFARGAL